MVLIEKRYLRPQEAISSPRPQGVVGGDCRHTSVPSRTSSTQRHDGQKRCGQGVESKREK